MRKTILAAAVLVLSSAAAFAGSPNTTEQSLRNQAAIEAGQAGTASFGLSSPAAVTADPYVQPAGSSRAATELRRTTYGD